MKRKQFAAIMMSMIIAATACLPLNSVSAFAAENTEAGTTEAAAITESEEIDEEEPETAVDEMVIDELRAAEEVPGTESGEEAKAADTEEGTQTADPAEEVQAAEDEDSVEEEASVQPEEEAQAEDTIEDAEDEGSADAGQGIEIPAGPETAGSDIISDLIIEEAVEDEVSRDAMEYGSDDYPYKNMSFGTYRQPQDVDPWKYFYRECTSFCAWRLNNTNGISFHNWYKGVNFGNAGTWISAAKQVGITVNKTPAIGAVACWTTGETGHVAWVCAVSGSTVTIEEYNGKYAGKYDKHTINASNPSGYIHFKDLACTHNYKIEKVLTSPTTSAKGKWQFKCSLCGTTSTRDIPVIGDANLTNGKYMILSKLGTDKYVSVGPNQNKQEGNIALYSKGKAEQTFTISKNSNGTYLIKYGNYVLDVYNREFQGNVWLYSPNGSSAQNWYIVPAGDGWYRITAQCTYYNMDVSNGDTADGTNIWTYYNNDTNSQLFKLVPVPDCSHNWVINKIQTAPTAVTDGAWLFKCSKCGETKTISIPAYGVVTLGGSPILADGKYMIYSKLDSDKYISVTPNQAYAGGNISLYSKNAADQTFEFMKKSNGCYLIKYGNYVLDVKDALFGATVQLNTPNGSAGQDWYIEPTEDGWYRLTSRATYYNAAVVNGRTADGTDITTWYDNGTISQQFKFVKASDPVPALTDVSDLDISVDDSRLIYDGTEKIPVVTLYQGDDVVTEGFKITYQNNVNTGIRTATVTVIGDNITYTGTRTVAFTIYPGKTPRGDMFNLANNVKVTWHEVPGAKYYKVYRTGVTDPGESLDEPVIVTDRLIGWDAKPGLTNGHAYRYKIVASLSGEGDSSGDSPLSYSKLMYRLKTVVIRSVKNTVPGGVTVKYDKTTSGDSYVLQYSENQDMSNAQTRVIKGADTTSYTIGGLKKGKTYYISIRVRKTVDGINYYTTFGVAKKITITK